MDAGVIRNLKYFYKLELVRRRIAAIENKQNFSINLLQAVHTIEKSWGKVTKQTIENCFKHVDLFRTKLLSLMRTPLLTFLRIRIQ